MAEIGIEELISGLAKWEQERMQVRADYTKSQFEYCVLRGTVRLIPPPPILLIENESGSILVNLASATHIAHGVVPSQYSGSLSLTHWDDKDKFVEFFFVILQSTANLWIGRLE